MSKVVKFYQTGGTEVLKVEERPIPEPSIGEVLVKIHASALNRAQLLYLQGAYAYPPQFPSMLGDEAVGVIEKLGAGVDRFAVGDRVSILSSTNMIANGTHAEHTVVSVDAVIPTPETLDNLSAAALWIAYLTAYAAIIEGANLQPGQPVVIAAASSSSGVAAIQIVKDVGGIEIATTRTSRKKEALLDLGTDYVITTEEEDVTARILEITQGKGAKVIFDPIGGEMLAKLAAARASGGDIYDYGVLEAGSLATTLTVPLVYMLSKRLQFLNLLDLLANPARLEKGSHWIQEALQKGIIKPIVDRVFKLDEIATALRYMEAGNQIGKILVTP
ncbi:MAG: zinc-dependent alcohol dehydrogenase family protein [Leptolyngbyaceae cyanobacterium CSU_1_3]|nr:zinc-dependent alcohol dehydrogenase family protein [Cyanobacteria bacterium RU_5_0]NJR52647.1 zinc-dependent alcohol dehydrogenase family protein [Leptolyngbyaceae cyanobacterium CSU_1_3]